MLGKIYEQRGMNAEAIRSYRTFLDLWREAERAFLSGHWRDESSTARI